MSVSTTHPSLLRIAESAESVLLSFVALNSFGEETAVDGINNWLCTDLSTTEESSVESLDGVLASLYTIKLQVYVTLSVGIKSNVDNMTVFLFTFSFDVVLELLDPSITLFPVPWSARS
jgi:hypothetical protein